MSHATFDDSRAGESRAGDADRPVERDTDPTETREERLQREHEQLFHELRAIIPGVEVLFAFMLTVAFTQRFEQLTDVQRWVYYLTFLCAGSGLLLLLAPASYHRVQFRRGDKEAMMRIANIEALTALIVISLAVAGTVFLITDLMFSTSAASIVAATMWTLICVLWWAVPLRRRMSEASERPTTVAPNAHARAIDPGSSASGPRPDRAPVSETTVGR